MSCSEQRYLPEDWNVLEQHRRSIFMNHMYKCSGRTNGLYTGLWQEFCLKEAGPTCVNMWFDQQRAIAEYKAEMAKREMLERAAPQPEPIEVCATNACQETFIPTYSD